MAVNREELQAELDEILAGADERTELLEAGAQRAEFLNDPVNEFGHAYTTGISNMLGVPVDIVNTVLNGIGISVDRPLGSGDNIQDVIDELENLPGGLPREPETPLAGAGEMLGAATVITPLMVLPFLDAAMDPNFEMRQQADIGKFQGTGMEETQFGRGKTMRTPSPGHIPRSRAARAAFVLKQIGERAAKFAVERPKTFVAAETAAALASGAAMTATEQAGGGPGTQMAAGVAAGVLAGITPAAIPRIGRNLARWGMRNIFPMTAEGAEFRAAAQMQDRAEDPIAAARAALDAPEGITPARATGERRLMAQERRVFEDDPILDKQIREDLEASIKRAEDELRGLFGTPRGRESWEQAVFQRVAPEGVEIRAGTSEQMLDQLYKEFRPLYDQFKGYPIMPNLFGPRKTSLETMIKNVPETNRIQADQATRDAVNRRLQSIWGGLKRRIKPDKDGTPIADSGDFLKFRQRLREEGRTASKRGDRVSASLYRIAEEKVNNVLRSQFKPEVLKELNRVDSHYRNYKLVEDATYRGAGTEKGLSPEGLLASLKNSASSKGGYARGEQLELRSIAVSGKPIAKMINEPARIRRAVETMSEADVANAKSDFFDTIVRKSMVSQDETEGVSGAKLKRMLEHYGESALAVRMTEDDMVRANTIADELITAERSSPAAVSQLYEDGPSNILQLFATLVGAKHGQRIAGRGMGSSLVLAQYFANKARGLLSLVTTEQATALLTRAQTDGELYAHLLTKPNVKPVVQIQSAQFINAYLAEMARETGVETMEHFEETYERRQETETIREELDRLRSVGLNP